MGHWFIDGVQAPFKSQLNSVFLMHGDTTCLMPNPDAEDKGELPYISFEIFLEKLMEPYHIAIFYNVATGMRFLKPEMEDLFRSLTGLTEDGPAEKDPVKAAKAQLGAKRGLPREPELCFPLIDQIVKTKKRMANGKPYRLALVVESAHLVAPMTSPGVPLAANERATIERLRLWGRRQELRTNRSIMFFLTDQEGKMSNELRSPETEIASVFIPKPKEKERLAFLQALCSSVRADTATNRAGSAASLSNNDLSLLTRATQGMSLRQVQEIFTKAQASGKSIDLEAVKRKKQEILVREYGDIMDVMEIERGFEDIGGLEHVKLHFKDILAAITSGEQRMVPMGVTLMGPPGTGKTAIVEAFAKEAGYTFVKIKSLRSMWLGESEARMERLTRGLRALAPVVVMNDEADLAEAGRDSVKGDSGVSERLMKMWMELLSDPTIRGQIIVISCTNRPDRIDAALKRSGRSDDRILLPMPSAKERALIFDVMFRRHKINVQIDDFAPFAKLTEGFSGADIEKITLESFRFAMRAGISEVHGPVLETAIADFIPNANQAEIDLMTLQGLLECSSRRLLPPNAGALLAGIMERQLVSDIEVAVTRLKERNVIARAASPADDPNAN